VIVPFASILRRAIRWHPARFALAQGGLAMVEFALALPMLLGLTLGGLEISNFIIASNTIQRLATSSADMLSQAGVGDITTSESQVYDMFYALDVAAKPLDLRNHGRVILTVIKGVQQSGGTVRNEFADAVYSQQFDGGYTAAKALLGCRAKGEQLAEYRSLPANEIMVHAQVSYEYQPLLPGTELLSYFAAPPVITRTAVFRMRKNVFQLTNDGAHPAKSNCTSKNGL
jgi:Flp pilus assembly protein TadG